MTQARKALNVLESTSAFVKAGLLEKPPVWMKVVASNPPQKDFTKFALRTKQQTTSEKPTHKLYRTRTDPHAAKTKFFKPQKLRFLEDDLRKLFFQQHPWELARPKNIIENTGDDEAFLDWDTIKQVLKPLDGESVVQRTLHLVKNKDNKLSMIEAYDQARLEFYRARIEQEIEQQVTLEESSMYGAVFTKSSTDLGFEAEAPKIAKWKEEALEQTSLFQTRSTAHIHEWASDAAEDTAEAVEDVAEAK
ncbi:hypothetical protein BABINDRAFT_11639 [Babjeviella inositovora NRRL Y-12698]|uniref:37S ribosomal protein S25, mitochondrial n=1 Tax=Babjeviella inositovora NRRL Y-12698 TaxID=984486 RepID=A0A1E3QV25_9ASCO|nr:uncharacterized protein BABINDRAFT_11639 [Babjeviella inositovora NRRL Y-12698]ODQ81505.1 hypothetical protein BABINDRAFT_11639 [Babjeviella inositovora NRRL Y-12698]